MIQYKSRDEGVGASTSSRLPAREFGSDISRDEIERGGAFMGEAIAHDLTEPQNEMAVLWRAVIIQALKDATRNLGLEKAVNATRALFTSINARQWLLGENANDDDFIDVCERAGVDPGAVRRQARDIINGTVEFNRRVDPIETAKNRRITLAGE